MYLNLKAEMVRQQVRVDDIADKLHIKPDTARRKINGQIGISISECKAIAELFHCNNSVEYLFATQQYNKGGNESGK